MQTDDTKFLGEMSRIDKMFQNHRFEEALPLAQRMYENFSRKPLAHVTIAICHFELGNTDKALKVLRNASKQFPHELDIVLNLGMIEEELEEYDEVLKYFQNA